jgi:hypothetical protein
MKTKLELMILSRQFPASAAFVLIGLIFSGSACQHITQPEPASTTLSQAAIDADVVWAIDHGIVDIYNQNVAGKPAGNQSISTNGPLGGTVVITGSDSYASNNGITTADLAFGMTNCKITENGGDVISLSLSGSVVEKGSWDSQGYESLNFQSQSLRVVGTVQKSGYADAAVNQISSYSATNTESNYQGSTTGIIDGRQVSWTW